MRTFRGSATAMVMRSLVLLNGMRVCWRAMVSGTTAMTSGGISGMPERVM